jgi:hypothetical protein
VERAVRVRRRIHLAGHGAHRNDRAGRFYLVQEAAGTTNPGPALPTPDATGGHQHERPRRQGRAGDLTTALACRTGCAAGRGTSSGTGPPPAIRRRPRPGALEPNASCAAPAPTPTTTAVLRDGRPNPRNSGSDPVRAPARSRTTGASTRSRAPRTCRRW